MSHQAESGPHVGRRRLFTSREAIQRFETTDVGVAPVEEADLAGGADSEAGGHQIAGVEGDAEDHLRAAGEIDAAAHAEPEQPDVRAATARRSYPTRARPLAGKRRATVRSPTPRASPRIGRAALVSLVHIITPSTNSELHIPG